MTVALKSFDPRVRPMNLLSALSKDPNRFNADNICFPDIQGGHQRSNALGRAGRDLHPGGAPHCLRWGALSAFMQGNERIAERIQTPS